MNKTYMAVAAYLFLALPAHAQRAPFAIPDPDPEVERKSFIIADGFEVNLYAADPLLAKPVQMNFDARGRLWVASSEVYPQIMPGQVANDKILILEDSDAPRETPFVHWLIWNIPGEAISLVSPSEMEYLARIEKLLKRKLPRLSAPEFENEHRGAGWQQERPQGRHREGTQERQRENEKVRSPERDRPRETEKDGSTRRAPRDDKDVNRSRPRAHHDAPSPRAPADNHPPFDFSKPYEPAAKDTAPAAEPARSHKRKTARVTPALLRKPKAKPEE